MVFTCVNCQNRQLLTIDNLSSFITKDDLSLSLTKINSIDFIDFTNHILYSYIITICLNKKKTAFASMLINVNKVIRIEKSDEQLS